MNRVGPYEITGELGRGGMGVVYRARREGSDTDVALKVIAAGEDASPEALARFQREARIATELDHPGIVKVLETGEDDGRVWFAMELVEGEPLSKQIKEREFTWQEAVTIVRDVADALAVAHDKGVLHRDIKPSNILMDAEGKPRLTDFGLAKDTRTESKYTRTGQTLGTPAYMSPEQARGDLAQLTPASDVWALGCVLQELLSNQPAFGGDTAAAVVGNVIGGQPAALTPGYPRPLCTLLAACLSKSPSHRPADAARLRRDLDRVGRGERPIHRPPRRRAPWVVAAAAAALIGAGVGAWVWKPEVATEPTVNPEAVRLATRGWNARIEDPAAGVDLLEHALGLESDRHDWWVQHGLLCWAVGRNDDARRSWEGVPEEAPQWHRARLYLALETMCRLAGKGVPEAEGRPLMRNAEAAARAPGDIGRIGAGLVYKLSGRDRDVGPALEQVAGW